MIVPLQPKLEGHAERRFFSIARQMLDGQAAGDPERISALVDIETTSAPGLSDIRGQHDEYVACVRVLGDLAHLRWRLVDSGYGLELHSPHPQRERVSDGAHAHQRKEAIRNELRPRVLQQFSDPNVRKFIRKMEHASVSSKRKSVHTVIADGAELQARLLAARQHPVDDPGRAEALRSAVRPYLQLVEPGLRDDYTGIPLGDIWRYFRYTWSIPQTPIPGRGLLYLVRDAAHKAHAIIGIAALSNCPARLESRDRAIGWSTSGLIDALRTLFATQERRAAREVTDPALRMQGVYQWLKQQFPVVRDPSPATQRAYLDGVIDWLMRGIATAIGEIEHHGLATEGEIAEPTPMVIERLRHLSREFATWRQDALTGRSGTGIPTNAVAAAVPVDDDLLDLEPKYSSNAPIQHSRRMLVRKKRAFELARLLDARRVLVANRQAVADPVTALATMEQNEVRTAINTALGAIKSRRIGTNLLEITTCGAVTPYNRILGGKLVALLLLSPQVAADNRRRYGQEATIIRSQLKNARLVPDNTLVWLGTTSLFSHGSSQYKRLRLPAGIVAPDQQEIRYTYLGHTTGYGTVQFADDTVRALDSLQQRRRGFRQVNSVFGEGASPRLRKLRSGLDAIGFDSKLIMLHHQGRRIYGVPLFPNAGAYLCGLEKDVPRYVRSPESYDDATERIAEFWRHRWLSSRLRHGATWAALGETPPQLLSSSIPPDEPPPPDANDAGSTTNDGEPGDDNRLAFWRRLARAGSNAVSEGLTDEDFDALHIETALDDYLLKAARKGHSIVLTGNAGDGKTHLARRLQRQLKSHANLFEFAFDATAIMSSDKVVAPVVDIWRQVKNARKSLVLAINQYPLYMLRRKLHRNLPDISEQLERQWKSRQTADPRQPKFAGDAVLLVDLSLRNPLSKEFAHHALAKMLDDPAVQRYAMNGNDTDFTFNYQSLTHTTVQDRLFELFERVISSGRRTTVRELWILIARLLFCTSTTDESPGTPQAWYSERLFTTDIRFPLTEALRRFADPAAVSHPHVDRPLEEPGSMIAKDWLVAGEPPDPLPSPASALGPANDVHEKYRHRFRALKRRFYFEHRRGGARVFELDPRWHADFHRVLQTPDDDDNHLSELLEAINRCYFPHHFDGIRDNLFLWIGHRLDEQPTKGYIADECMPRDRLRISRTEPPGALRDALAYVPDHLILSVIQPRVRASTAGALRIDANLFQTLFAVRRGLSRHLINPGELNRLDTFVDCLRRSEPVRRPEFLIYNAEHVAAGAVKMSPGLDRYLHAHRF